MLTRTMLCIHLLPAGESSYRNTSTSDSGTPMLLCGMRFPHDVIVYDVIVCFVLHIVIHFSHSHQSSLHTQAIASIDGFSASRHNNIRCGTRHNNIRVH